MQLEVAVPAPLPQTFTYRSPEQVPRGARVLVPFGKQKMIGVVLRGDIEEEAKAAQSYKIKDVLEVIDQQPVFSPVLLQIAEWLSQYYLYPLGEVLSAMLPASRTQQTKLTYELTAAGEQTRGDSAAEASALLTAFFGKKKTSLAAASFQKRLKKLVGEGVVQEASLQQCIEQGLIKLQKDRAIVTRRIQETQGYYVADATRTPESPRTLTPVQSQVFEHIIKQDFATAKPQLLWGLTGSGKTEIYLQTIEHTFRDNPDAQALMLVPEISLTPQMTRVFDARFPGQVAVVHSGLTDQQRWDELERIRRGEARILIGPRSAVFGPFRHLKIIVVDEEHDGSYKQGSGLLYNGRDVAILRGKLEKALVILGSATPSLESYAHAQSGKYDLLPLKERVSGRPLPRVDVYAFKPKGRKGLKGAQPVVGHESGFAIEVLDEIIQALRETVQAGKQAMVIVNRRGFAFYLYSLETQAPVTCPQCTISLTVHNRSTTLKCHYCDHRMSVKRLMQDRPNETFVSIGYGSQQAEEYLCKQLPEARIVRIDSDTAAKREDLTRNLSDFAAGKIDILVGTQILAKGHDYPNVTTIAILEADQALNLPDFRAGERTFQLIVQAAGRAGRDLVPGRVLIQTMRPNHPIIQLGAAQDYEGFAERELGMRKGGHYPPFERLVLIECQSELPALIQKNTELMAQWLDQYLMRHQETAKGVTILGPASPPIEVIRGKHRRIVMVLGEDVNLVRKVARDVYHFASQLKGNWKLKIDVDPQSLI